MGADRYPESTNKQPQWIHFYLVGASSIRIRSFQYYYVCYDKNKGMQNSRLVNFVCGSRNGRHLSSSSSIRSLVQTQIKRINNCSTNIRNVYQVVNRKRNNIFYWSYNARRSYMINLDYTHKYIKGKAVSAKSSWDNFKNLPYSPGRGSDFENQSKILREIDVQMRFAGLPLLHRALTFAIQDFVMMRDIQGIEYSYMQGLIMSSTIHDYFIQKCFLETQGERILILCNAGRVSYITSMMAAFSTGSIAVPIGIFPDIVQNLENIEFILNDCDPSIIVVDQYTDMDIVIEATDRLKMTDLIVKFEDMIPDASKVKNLSNEQLTIDLDFNLGQDGFIPSIDSSGVIIYNSTENDDDEKNNKMKGILMNHRTVHNQVIDLVEHLEMTTTDRFLCFESNLDWKDPLLCLWSGACCEYMPFQPNNTWDRIGDSSLPQLSIIKGNPIIYRQLLHSSELYSLLEWKRIMKCFTSIRLNLSTEFPLTATFGRKWKHLTGGKFIHEFYNKTECGVPLANDCSLSKYMFGSVGKPLMSVDLRLVDANENQVAWGKGRGELRVMGSTVFSKYWNNPSATKGSFDANGYFKTGTLFEYDEKNDCFKVLSNSLSDVSCSGERTLLDLEKIFSLHPDILVAYVIIIHDKASKKEGTGVVCVLRGETKQPISLQSLQDWSRVRMHPDDAPKAISVVSSSSIPRDTFGKVRRKKLSSLFE